MAYTSAIRGKQFGIADRVAALVTALRDGMQRYRVYRQTMTELRLLSDRDLADLGIHRSMIGSIAMEAAYGK